MKKILLLGAFVALFTLSSQAQTQPGFNITATIGAVDFTEKLPLNSYLGDHAGRQNLNLGIEAGYFGNVLGLAATVQSDFDLDSEALVGLKGFVKIAEVHNVTIRGAVAARRFVNEVSGNQYQYAAELGANFPLFSKVYSRLAAQANINGDQGFDNIRPGVLFGLGYSF